MLDNWQRIEQIIKWAGSPSVNAFAREIGLNRGENLYQIKRGNNGISRDLAETVTSKYPEISKAWLLTGEGDMLPRKSDRIRYEVPFFKMDALELIGAIDEARTAPRTRRPGDNATTGPEPEYYISFPMMQGADFASFSLSDAMQPEIPSGSVVFLKNVELGAIVPGSPYLVTGRTFSGIRTLRRDPGSDRIRLVPKNPDYDEVVISSDDIERLFLVKGVLQVK